jgi:ABC-type enterochelin transport system permease subunit
LETLGCFLHNSFLKVYPRWEQESSTLGEFCSNLTLWAKGYSMVLTTRETTKVLFWSVAMPISMAVLVGLTMGAPYSSLSGMLLLLAVAQIYRELDAHKYEAFKRYASMMFFLFAMALAGWADR